jgi:hypothetical protein
VQLAERLQTSRSQVDRLLDPDNTAITLESLERLASAVGRQLRIDLAKRFVGKEGRLPHGSSPGSIFTRASGARRGSGGTRDVGQIAARILHTTLVSH